MARIIIDEREAPLITVRFPVEGSLEDLRAYYTELEALLKRHDKLVFIVDMSKVNALKVNTVYRRTASACFLHIKDLFFEHALAEAYLIANPLMQGIFVAFNWLSGTYRPYPQKVFRDEFEARAWLKTYLPTPAV